jgi:protein SCO1/2
MVRTSRQLVVGALLGLLACGSHERRFELVGQILSIDTPAQTLTIKHQDIPGFMPGMTMPFRVKDAALLADRKPGDLIRATLVVEDADAYLDAIAKTGWAPVPEGLEPSAPPVAVLEPGAEVSDQVFVDQDGREVALSGWRGQVVALTFIYTRCPYPTFCPLMDRQFKVVQARIAGDEALHGRVHLLSLSFDPEHDTPPVLLEHANGLGADPGLWTFATARLEEIDRFAAQFGLLVTRNPSDPLDITHSLSTAVIDPTGRLVSLHRGNAWSPDDLLAEIRHAAALD